MRVHGAGSQGGPPPGQAKRTGQESGPGLSFSGSYRFRPAAGPVAPEVARGPEESRPETRAVTTPASQKTSDHGRVAE